MDFDVPKERFAGKIREVVIGATKEKGGTRGSSIVVGGSDGFPFHRFESQMPHMPVVVMDVVDTPRLVPETLLGSMGSFVKEPVEWAKKCENEWKADALLLRLASANPEEENRSVEECESLFKEVLKSVSLPMLVYGCGSEEKDAKLMEAVSNAGKGERLFLGLAEEKAFKSLAAASMANGHGIVAFSNLDINLAKQMNILLLDFGVKPENIIIDPLMAALGMGLEYSYSVVERLRQGALSGDPVLQMPIICDSSCAWNVPDILEEDPKKGDILQRGILWEAITAYGAIVAGADLVIMRHPDAVALFRQTLNELTGGG
ncbi:MAG: acetyl-CoA decarbonylase/synthase complex subunit delta [Candidatus Thermoplasmatota archaeon]|nr:acetyl-CoA decarbonylase/synthase complex subunit delta [Candidatus Thermoplasmatota archaeon]